MVLDGLVKTLGTGLSFYFLIALFTDSVIGCDCVATVIRLVNEHGAKVE